MAQTTRSKSSSHLDRQSTGKHSLASGSLLQKGSIGSASAHWSSMAPMSTATMSSSSSFNDQEGHKKSVLLKVKEKAKKWKQVLGKKRRQDSIRRQASIGATPTESNLGRGGGGEEGGGGEKTPTPRQSLTYESEMTIDTTQKGETSGKDSVMQSPAPAGDQANKQPEMTTPLMVKAAEVVEKPSAPSAAPEIIVNRPDSSVREVTIKEISAAAAIQVNSSTATATATREESEVVDPTPANNDAGNSHENKNDDCSSSNNNTTSDISANSSSARNTTSNVSASNTTSNVNASNTTSNVNAGNISCRNPSNINASSTRNNITTDNSNTNSNSNNNSNNSSSSYSNNNNRSCCHNNNTNICRSNSCKALLGPSDSMTQTMAPKIQERSGPMYEIAAKQVRDKSLSMKEYLLQKLEPGEEDRALSKVITEIVTPIIMGYSSAAKNTQMNDSDKSASASISTESN